MRFSSLISATALGATFAVASDSEGHQHKRAITYVTDYRTTTVWAKAPMTVQGASTTVVVDSNMPTPTGDLTMVHISRGEAVPHVEVPHAETSPAPKDAGAKPSGAPDSGEKKDITSQTSSTSSAPASAPASPAPASPAPSEPAPASPAPASPAPSEPAPSAPVPSEPAAPSAPVPSEPAAPSAPVPSEPAAPSAPAPSEPAPSAAPSSTPASSEPASSSSTTSASTSPAASSGTEFTSGGGARGITYSPYDANNQCKPLSQIKSEVSTLGQFPILRIYGVDCDQVASLLQAKQSHQKLFLGIYKMSEIEDGVRIIKEAIDAHGSWDDVDTISIGNELVNEGTSVSQVAGYMSIARKALADVGYKGPVVSVDTFIAVINNPGLCELSDYMAVNAHAYFDKNTPAALAGPWVLQQIQRVWSTCKGNKKVVVTETGWPSRGQQYGLAIPSKVNQLMAINSIKATCGNSAILFSAFDEFWKIDGPWGVEKYWGLFSL